MQTNPAAAKASTISGIADVSIPVFGDVFAVLVVVALVVVVVVVVAGVVVVEGVTGVS